MRFRAAAAHGKEPEWSHLCFSFLKTSLFCVQHTKNILIKKKRFFFFFFYIRFQPASGDINWLDNVHVRTNTHVCFWAKKSAPQWQVSPGVFASQNRFIFFVLRKKKVQSDSDSTVAHRTHTNTHRVTHTSLMEVSCAFTCFTAFFFFFLPTRLPLLCLLIEFMYL